MRALLDFLGLAWDEAVLDHQATAAKRGPIARRATPRSPSRSTSGRAGRWERYRAQMAPVLPILAPWAEKMGYELRGRGSARRRQLQRAVAFVDLDRLAVQDLAAQDRVGERVLEIFLDRPLQRAARRRPDRSRPGRARRGRRR